jgi:Rrf2 family protein
MRISAKCDYACKALLELSLHWPKKKPLQIRPISEKQDIPMKYLIQILIQLKRMKYAESSRGKQGGYNLSKPPNEITLGEVIRNTGGPLLPLSNSAAKKELVFKKIWEEVETAMAKILDKITFEDIANKAKSIKESIIYQI